MEEIAKNFLEINELLLIKQIKIDKTIKNNRNILFIDKKKRIQVKMNENENNEVIYGLLGFAIIIFVNFLIIPILLIIIFNAIDFSFGTAIVNKLGLDHQGIQSTLFMFIIGIVATISNIKFITKHSD